MRSPEDVPGESEFGWGEGLMPDPTAEPPSVGDQLRAAHAVNLKSDDPSAVEGYQGKFVPRKGT